MEGSPARRYRDGARAVAPLAVAVLGFGISFGLLARSAGMSWLAPIVMSATTFAGSAQFAAVSILGAGGTVAAAVAAAVLLNLRYAPIGVSVAPWLEEPAWWRFLRAQLVVDESWAVAAEGEGRFDPPDPGRCRALSLRVLGGRNGHRRVRRPGPRRSEDPRAGRGLPRAVPRPADPPAPEPTGRRGGRARRGHRARAHPIRAAGVPIIAASAACLIRMGRR